MMFVVGDHVQVVSHRWGAAQHGKTGKIEAVREGGNLHYRVMFDQYARDAGGYSNSYYEEDLAPIGGPW